MKPQATGGTESMAPRNDPEPEAGLRHIGHCDAFAPFIRFLLWGMRHSRRMEKPEIGKL
jgi:hypothetical protein